MSLGYAPTSPPPFDPDDPNTPGAPPALPPPPIPAPAPAGLAGVDVGAVAGDIGSVGQPPAPAAPSAGTGLAGLDVDKAAANLGAVGAPGAPVADPAAPGAVPVPAPETGAPTPTPAALTDLQKAQADEKTAREASDKANAELAKAQQAGVEANQRIADQRVKDEQEAQRQRAETVQRYQTAEAAAQKQIEQTQAAVKGFKFRDYFSDGKDGTDWARKIVAALATALGAFGAGLTHGPNYALQILNKDMDDSHQAQLDDLGKMKDQEVMARTGLADAQSARAKALADLTVGDAARDRLVAAQLEQAAARNKTAEFSPGLVAAAQKLKLDAAEKDTAAKKQLVELNMKLADEGRKADLDKASIAEKNAAAHLHTVQADAGGFSPHHGKGGGGGGAGSGGHADALGEILNGGNAADVQKKYGLSDKAMGQVLTSAGKVGAAGARQAHTDQIDTKDIDKRADAIKKEVFGPKGPGTQYERLNGMTAVVDNALKNNDKTAATAILEEAGGMLSGGKSTKNTVALLEELRSSRDELSAKWGHLTGDPGASAAFTARLNGLLNRVKEEKRQEIDQIRKRAVDTELGEHGLAREGKAKERALGHIGGIFGGVTNANGAPRYGEGGGAVPPPPPALVDEAKVARARAAQNSPAATPQQKANAAAYLKLVGR